MKTRANRIAGGISWGDLLIIIVTLMLLALVVLARLARPRVHICKINCMNNLKQIGLAYRQWAIDNGDKFPMQVSVTNGGAMELAEVGQIHHVFRVMSNELNTPKLLICPEESNSSRVAAITFGGAEAAPAPGFSFIPFTNNNNVSYFVGLDADETKPAMLLGGDDNILLNGKRPAAGWLLQTSNRTFQWTTQRHKLRGNLLFADGSVSDVPNSDVAKVLARTGATTNRLVLP